MRHFGHLTPEERQRLFHREPGLFTSYSPAKVLATALGAVPWVDGVTAGDGRLIVSVSDEAAASAGLLPMVVAAGLRLATFERVRPSLEDVFLRLVGRDGGEAAA